MAHIKNTTSDEQSQEGAGYPSSRYPPSAYTCRTADDFIDFPCSSTWLSHYHELGLTPRSAPEPANTHAVVEKLEELRVAIYDLGYQLRLTSVKLAVQPPKGRRRGVEL
jgi:hypothetical protein